MNQVTVCFANEIYLYLFEYEVGNIMKRNSLKINAILNGLKQCFGIIFPLITFPYVSRVLGEEGFGKYSFSWSVVSYFVLLAGFGISTYAIREGARIRDNKQKLSIFCSEVFTINIITTILSFLLLMIVSIASGKIHGYISLIIVESSALILNLVGRDWMNSIYEDYIYITIRYLIIQIISLILMFALIRSSDDVWKYCAISIFASFGGNIFNVFYLRRYPKTRVVAPKIKKHISTLLVLFATQVAITVYVNADITMLGFFSNNSIVGIYSLASKIYSMVKTVVNAMVLATLPRMTYIIGNAPEEYNNAIRKISSYLIVILIPTALGIFMLSDEIILIVGGANYKTGGLTLRILSGAIIIAVLCSFCMNSILIAHRQEGACLKATMLSATVNVLLNFVALPLWNMTGAAITTIIAEAVNLFMLLKSSGKIINLKLFDWKNVIQSILASTIIVFICFLVQRQNLTLILTVIISVIICVVSYFTILFFMGNNCIREMLEVVKYKIFRRGQN